jgi:hypothetical protein
MRPGGVTADLLEEFDHRYDPRTVQPTMTSDPDGNRQRGPAASASIQNVDVATRADVL